MVSQRTVLITGCSKGGIGYSLVKEFAAQNWHVFATARKLPSMDGLVALPNVTLLQLDISSPASILAACAEVSSKTDGKLDILYQNAGYRSVGMATESSTEEAFKTFNTNFFGVLEMNKAFTDLLIKAKGRIVFTGSVSAYTPHPTTSVYVASKAALAIYAETLRIEMKPFGVRVVHIATAAVSTGMTISRLQAAEDSKYKYFEAEINKGWEDLETTAMDADAYAKAVVPQVIKANPKDEIWAGSGAWKVWAVEHFHLRWLYPRAFASMYGLDRLAPSESKEL